MSSIVKNARSNNIWYQLHKATGFSSSYCKKVVMGDRKKRSKGAKQIMEKFDELSKILEPCKKQT
ncbi:hypothetical protein SAMN05443634_104118 [Chishuiella changwenlii]|jgi:hypothetical protein|uniref:Uncharacterized protein n=1 Tax=Chishuiella changwenlii TaxID=1434701 RepID=A0A1M6W0V7_9FLAO|nr:hypothetical protein [Chishuiella changwenlii]GGE89352.1 hypothetical protein GCM10010984_03730 [Chishuiella changwenlii]SHK87422.1 hypothetical protein SAMN05443634_104118 [Chishuiella changwenlii]